MSVETSIYALQPICIHWIVLSNFKSDYILYKISCRLCAQNLEKKNLIWHFFQNDPFGPENLLHKLSTEYEQECIPVIWTIVHEVYPNATDKYEKSNQSLELNFQMDPVADITWTVVFTSMLVCAVVGNLIVFWIVLGKLFTIFVTRLHNWRCTVKRIQIT